VKSFGTLGSRVVAYAPALLWASLLLHSGGRSDLTKPDTGLPIDKVAHLVVYGILGALAAFGWRRAGRWPALAWPLLLSLVVGVADEWRQQAVPGRSPDGIDLLMDAIGIALGAMLLLRLYPSKHE
jgi:VanZ family protein